MSKILTLNNLSYSVEEKLPGFLRKTKKIILHNISLEFEAGKTLGIAGESGSGKTTLAKIIAGIIKPASGEIDSPHKRKNQKISPVQILFQNTGEIINPLRTLNIIVEEPLKIRGLNKTEIKIEKEKIFNLLNLPGNLRNRKGFELSGGEQQRAALARILATKPELLILDEPFSAQDTEEKLNLLNLFSKIIKGYNISLIIIAHNLQMLKKLCDEIIILYKGEIVEAGITKNIFEQPQHDYTKFLLKAENYSLSHKEIIEELNKLK